MKESVCDSSSESLCLKKFNVNLIKEVNHDQKTSICTVYIVRRNTWLIQKASGKVLFEFNMLFFVMPLLRLFFHLMHSSYC